MPHHPPVHELLEDARRAILDDYLARRKRRPENRLTAERGADRGLKAVRLAPNLTLCRALLTGERVPWQQLDARQAELHGIRQRLLDARYGLEDFNDVSR